jgi:hypothetical protein
LRRKQMYGTPEPQKREKLSLSNLNLVFHYLNSI